MAHNPIALIENKRLDALVGRWRSHGQMMSTDPSDPAIEIAGSDTYEWLTGGFFLLHRVDVRVGDDQVEVVEMIGPYDPATGTYPMRSFDNHGAFVTMQASVADDGVWTFTGDTERATLVIADDRATMSATWERTDDTTTWHPWMTMSFTRLS
ncbi:DUF1579 family protein [Streptosporangium roseum]|uniref:DUF1579 domain-containing protein n=1 Tax=Streptosporangium roseum (strain ATCC 12428 / DSM 43021 / JCM 3005 / KCTC 9067 / NCIMB 10171 / NRRL 2505 / NI 9100) TaxID=479432 RepID=D2B7K9_STRRD|nr:DUF1579 family protein [Streptosporangium roseum]ACZ91530.1 hypothetical protein Sros_8898 [Streptosporangium roseum DSM 43021]